MTVERISRVHCNVFDSRSKDIKLVVPFTDVAAYNKYAPSQQWSQIASWSRRVSTPLGRKMFVVESGIGSPGIQDGLGMFYFVIMARGHNIGSYDII